ncbi:MAG: NYN domain-containing protein, partial [Lutibacter sp.]
MIKDIKLAVLIDGDNIPSKYIKEMMEEIAKYGTPTIKRIYGDWTKPQLGKWKTILLENAITPIQQYGYTTGKNATDSAMIIDAMDILYS